MNDTAFFVLFWGGYAAWVTLFVWIAWVGRLRLLVALGAVMLVAFAISWTFMQRSMADPTRNHSGDLGYGLLMLFAVAVLLVPLAVAAIVYPIGRLWAR